MDYMNSELVNVKGQPIQIDSILTMNFDPLKDIIKFLYLNYQIHDITLKAICSKLGIEMKSKNYSDFPGLEINNIIKSSESIDSQMNKNENTNESNLNNSKSKEKNIENEKINNDLNGQVSKKFNKYNITLNLEEIEKTDLKQPNMKIPPSPSSVPNRVQELEKDLENAINRINQISKTVTQLVQKSAINTPGKSSELINWKEKTDKIKSDLKAQFADLSDFQSLNVKFEKINLQIEEFYKNSNDLFNLTNTQLKSKVENLETKVENLVLELKNLQNDEDAQNEPSHPLSNEEHKLKSKKYLDSKNDKESSNMPIRNHSQMKAAKVSGILDLKKNLNVTENNKKITEITNQIEAIKQKIEHFPPEFNDVIKKSKEILGMQDKFATKLEIKKVLSNFSELANKFDDMKLFSEKNNSNKDQNRNDYEELRLRMNSIDTRSQASVKNIKALENRINEMSLIPQMTNNVNDLNNNQYDEKFESVAEDFNDKFSKLREQLSILKSEMNKINKDVDTKVENKVGKDDIIELENRVYKELDKLVSNFTRKISNKCELSRVYAVEGNVKKVFQEMLGLSNIDLNKDNNKLKLNDNLNLNCASCDKDLVNLCMKQQKEMYNTWSKFPSKDFDDKLKSTFSLSSTSKNLNEKYVPSKIQNRSKKIVAHIKCESPENRNSSSIKEFTNSNNTVENIDQSKELFPNIAPISKF